MIQKVLKLMAKPIAKLLLGPKRPVYDGEEWDLGKYGCPDCGYTEIYKGPEGGGAINICCGNPFCRSAFWDGGFMGLKRIPNTVFRSAFPECPEESDAYLKAQIYKMLADEDSGMEGWPGEVHTTKNPGRDRA